MALKASDYKSESKFDRPDPLEPGTYPGRLVQVISLGLQPQRPYKGDEKPPKHEIYTTYELLDEFLKDEEGNDIEDKPRWISETFTMNSLDSDLAKSTKRYLALDPKNIHKGDWAKIVGAPGMITIIQNAKEDVVYNNISSVQSMRAKEADNAPDLVNEPKVFDIDDPDIEVFLSLPTWLQDKIKDNLEYEGSILEKKLNEHQNPEETKPKKKAAKPVKEVEVETEEEETDEEW